MTLKLSAFSISASPGVQGRALQSRYRFAAKFAKCYDAAVSIEDSKKK